MLSEKIISLEKHGFCHNESGEGYSYTLGPQTEDMIHEKSLRLNKQFSSGRDVNPDYCHVSW